MEVIEARVRLISVNLEDRFIGVVQSEQGKFLEKKNDQCFMDLWDNTKSLTFVSADSRVPEGEEKKSLCRKNIWKK